eukprot:scaffold11032_cov122-Cylindrotheca_fusiformis.AAC.3
MQGGEVDPRAGSITLSLVRATGVLGAPLADVVCFMFRVHIWVTTFWVCASKGANFIRFGTASISVPSPMNSLPNSSVPALQCQDTLYVFIPRTTVEAPNALSSKPVLYCEKGVWGLAPTENGGLGALEPPVGSKLGAGSFKNPMLWPFLHSSCEEEGCADNDSLFWVNQSVMIRVMREACHWKMMSLKELSQAKHAHEESLQGGIDDGEEGIPNIIWG